MHKSDSEVNHINVLKRYSPSDGLMSQWSRINQINVLLNNRLWLINKKDKRDYLWANKRTLTYKYTTVKWKRYSPSKVHGQSSKCGDYNNVVLS